MSDADTGKVVTEILATLVLAYGLTSSDCQIYPKSDWYVSTKNLKWLQFFSSNLSPKAIR